MSNVAGIGARPLTTHGTLGSRGTGVVPATFGGAVDGPARTTGARAGGDAAAGELAAVCGRTTGGVFGGGNGGRSSEMRPPHAAAKTVSHDAVHRPRRVECRPSMRGKDSTPP